MLLDVFQPFEKMFTPSLYMPDNLAYVKDIEGAKKLFVDLPGVKKEDVSIEAANGFIKIAAERKDHKKGKIEKSYSVSSDFNLDAITAEMSDGVLTVIIPTLAKSKKTIKVT